MADYTNIINQIDTGTDIYDIMGKHYVATYGTTAYNEIAEAYSTYGMVYCIERITAPSNNVSWSLYALTQPPSSQLPRYTFSNGWTNVYIDSSNTWSNEAIDPTLITTADIDEICGTTLTDATASEVTF